MDDHLRMTHQREIILKELKKFQYHPTADELYERVKKKLPRISLATVYRNLETLSKAGLVKKIAISGRQKRFDHDPRPHCHIYCTACHRVDNIEPDPALDLTQLPLDARGYEIAGCRIEYFGLCRNCVKKKKGA